MKVEIAKNPPNVKNAKSSGAFSVMWREIVKDKLALGSLILLGLILIIVYGASLLLDQEKIVTVDLLSIYNPPSAQHLLGTDTVAEIYLDN